MVVVLGLVRVRATIRGEDAWCDGVARSNGVPTSMIKSARPGYSFIKPVLPHGGASRLDVSSLLLQIVQSVAAPAPVEFTLANLT